MRRERFPFFLIRQILPIEQIDKRVGVLNLQIEADRTAHEIEIQQQNPLPAEPLYRERTLSG